LPPPDIYFNIYYNLQFINNQTKCWVGYRYLPASL